MEHQAIPLAPDVEYFIDAAVEHEELDAGAALVLKLYAPRPAVMAIADEEYRHDGQSTMVRRVAKCGRLTELADSIFRELPQDVAAPLAWGGVLHVRHWMRGVANMMAWWAQEDMIKGGCGEPYIKPISLAQARRIQDYRPTPKQARRLASPTWIRRYVKRSQDTARLRRMGDVVLRRVCHMPFETALEATVAIAEILEAQHESYRRTNERALRQFYHAEYVQKRQDNRRQRKIIQRAARTAVSVLGHEAVQRWSAGHTVRLVGQTIAVEAARAGSSATLGHGGVILAAVDAKTGRKLADMCLFHERTPALDQLTALALAFQAGEEAEVIATANLTNVTPIGEKHPLIAGHSSARRVAAWMPRDMIQERNESYWNAHREIYMDALGTQVLGRMWPRVKSL